MRKRIWARAHTASALVFMIAASSWAADRMVIDDDFSDGESNAGVWSVTQSGPLVASEIQGAFVATTPGKEQGKGRLSLNTPAHGDLTVEIDYDARLYSGGADGRILLSAQGPSTYASVYYHRFDAERCEVVFGGTLDGAASIYAYHEQASNTGKLRLVRTGATFTAFYWDGVAWKSIGAKDGFKEDAGIRIQFQSTSACPAFEFRVTRFHLESEGVPAQLAFTTQPAGCRRYADEGDYTLKAAANGGLGTLKYEWFRDTGTGPVSAGTGETLTLEKPTPAMSGKYRCKVSDASGAVQSKPANVRFGERIQFTQQPKNAHRRTGDGPVTFNAAAKGGVGTLSYAWRHVTAAGTVTVSKVTPYIINTPTAADAGAYWCEATDGLHTTRSNTVTIASDAIQPNTTVVTTDGKDER